MTSAGQVIGPLWAWRRSLAVRATLLLTLVLAVIEGAGLCLHAVDRAELRHLAQARAIATGVTGLYRIVVLADAASRPQLVASMAYPHDFSATLGADPPSGLTLAPAPVARLLRANMSFVTLPIDLRPHQFVMLGGFGQHVMVVGLHLPDGTWLSVRALVPPQYLWTD